MQNGFGLPIAALLLLMIVDFIGRTKTVRGITTSQKAALAVCFLAAPSMVVGPLLGKNQNINHAAPALILLAMLVGLLADATKWTSVPWRAAAAGTVLLL